MTIIHEWEKTLYLAGGASRALPPRCPGVGPFVVEVTFMPGRGVGRPSKFKLPPSMPRALWRFELFKGTRRMGEATPDAKQTATLSATVGARDADGAVPFTVVVHNDSPIGGHFTVVFKHAESRFYRETGFRWDERTEQSQVRARAAWNLAGVLPIRSVRDVPTSVEVRASAELGSPPARDNGPWEVIVGPTLDGAEGRSGRAEVPGSTQVIVPTTDPAYRKGGRWSIQVHNYGRASNNLYKVTYRWPVAILDRREYGLAAVRDRIAERLSTMRLHADGSQAELTLGGEAKATCTIPDLAIWIYEYTVHDITSHAPTISLVESAGHPAGILRIGFSFEEAGPELESPLDDVELSGMTMTVDLPLEVANSAIACGFPSVTASVSGTEEAVGAEETKASAKAFMESIGLTLFGSPEARATIDGALRLMFPDRPTGLTDVRLAGGVYSVTHHRH